MTVGELLGRVSSRELAEWQTYYELGADQAVLAELERRALARLEAKTRRR